MPLAFALKICSLNIVHSPGVLLISLALCADAVIGNVQEKTLKEYSASNVELVLYSYFVGVFYILFGLLLSGSLVPAFEFCLKVFALFILFDF